jgi:hypothetical protein
VLRECGLKITEEYDYALSQAHRAFPKLILCFLCLFTEERALRGLSNEDIAMETDVEDY